MKSICVYCGSAPGTNPAYAVTAREMGRLLASSGRVVVYGGGGVGLMGEVARSAMEAGGHVIGVIPTHLNTRERAYDAVDLRVVNSMHERKQTMADLSDAFVAMPGGLGTFDELFEILTWGQIGLHVKPVGVLNVAGYFDALLAMIDLAVREGFAPAATRARIVSADTPAVLIDALEHSARSATLPSL
ncbi:MAG: TIGR00730 family Rossman fold protein [Vicinamibacteria bacterium]